MTVETEKGNYEEIKIIYTYNACLLGGFKCNRMFKKWGRHTCSDGCAYTYR